VRFVSGDEAAAFRERHAWHGIWPEFLLHDAVSNRYWGRLEVDFPDFQFLLVDGERVLGEGNCVPVRGMPLAWRDAILNAWEGDGEPDRVCALAIIVSPDLRGSGLSGRLLAHMRELAAPFGTLVAPVRPTQKADRPLMPLDEYVQLRREDGSHVDPWIRTHERLGGVILGPAEDAMLIEGSHEEWQAWTGLDLPRNGAATVPGALVPVQFADGHGVYREPCVWIEHRLAA
jgi:GNAT superfamily N-acetyltransferase